MRIKKMRIKKMSIKKTMRLKKQFKKINKKVLTIRI